MAVPGLTWLATGAEAAGLVFLQQPQTRLPRQIGPISVNVAVEEDHLDRIEITEHPVEFGARISDHAYVLPREVVIHAAWSDSPSVFDTGLLSIPGDIFAGLAATFSSPEAQSVIDIYHNLVILQRSFQLLTIITGKETYGNMLIQSLQTHTDRQWEHALMVTAVCREVILVNAQTIQGQPSETGNAPITPVDRQMLGAPPNNDNMAAPQDTGIPVSQGAVQPGPSQVFGTSDADKIEGGITFNPALQNAFGP